MISILHGLKPKYEVHHGVEIADSTLVTGVSWFSYKFFAYDPPFSCGVRCTVYIR